MTKQSGYATKQTGYFWTKQLGLNSLLLSAKAGNEDAITAILQMYRPLLLKYAIIDGVLDEDLYQELSIILLKAIKLFKI